MNRYQKKYLAATALRDVEYKRFLEYEDSLPDDDELGRTEEYAARAHPYFEAERKWWAARQALIAWCLNQKLLAAKDNRQKAALDKLLSEGIAAIEFDRNDRWWIKDGPGYNAHYGLKSSLPSINNRRVFNSDMSIKELFERAEKTDHRVKIMMEEIEATRKKIYHDRQQEREERERRQAEREALQKDELDMTITEALTRLGKTLELKQYKDGYLSDEAQRDNLRQYLWSDLDDGIKRYRRLKAADIEHAEDCGGYGDIEFDVEDAKTMSSEDYQFLIDLRNIFPEADGWQVEPRAHTGLCETCDAKVERIGIHVSREVGPYTISREYQREYQAN